MTLFVLPSISGLLYSLTYLDGLYWLGFICLVPLFISLKGKGPKESGLIGFVFGFALFLTLCYWIIGVMCHYGGLNPLVSFLIFLAVAAYLSVYPLLFVLTCGHLFKRKYGLFFIPSAWVMTEYMRATFFTGFPWWLLGYSLAQRPLLAQIAELGGVYLLSFIMCFINLCVYSIVFSEKFLNRFLFLGIIFSVMGFQISYGWLSLRQTSPELSHLKVLVVQPNIPQEMKWKREYQEDSTKKLLETTWKAMSALPDLVVWPETATPFFFQDESYLTQMVKARFRGIHANLLLGSPAYEKEGSKVFYYNRAYLYDPNKERVEYYDKIRLVPFGEYIPIRFLASLVEKIVGEMGEFRPGKNKNTIEFNGIKIGMLICYESIFPELSLQAKKLGANVLINITNDAWFGKTSAPYQHFYMAILRAIENRVPLIRCANTGISGVIDEYGRIVKKTMIFNDDFFVSEVRIPRNESTFYNRVGYLFPEIMVLCFLLYLGATFIKQRPWRLPERDGLG